MLRLGLSVAAVVFVLDQLSKWWIRVVVMEPPRDIPITPFFSIVYARNTGVSFSLFRADSLAGQLILSGVALAIVAGLLVWMRRLARRWPVAALGLIVGGAIGNVVDRLRLGAVVDFLYFHGDAYPAFCGILDRVGLGWLECQWPSFNVADSAIFIGVVMLLFDGLFGREEKAKTAPN
jgi:signal peptidase II